MSQHNNSRQIFTAHALLPEGYSFLNIIIHFLVCKISNYARYVRTPTWCVKLFFSHTNTHNTRTTYMHSWNPLKIRHFLTHAFVHIVCMCMLCMHNSVKMLSLAPKKFPKMCIHTFFHYKNTGFSQIVSSFECETVQIRHFFKKFY